VLFLFFAVCTTRTPLRNDAIRNGYPHNNYTVCTASNVHGNGQFLADVIRLYVHSIEATVYDRKDSEYKYFLYTIASVGHFI